MRLFGRRGRSRSVDRSRKSKNDNRQPPYHDQQSTGYLSDKRSHTAGVPEDDSVGSELPTLDQFEIAVPSRSFANSSGGEREFAPEAREEMDNRSTTDISSITSVSYRAGYYYLRNIKKKPPVKKANQTWCGCLPNCSCASCMPCSCSWLTCCCCAEAKSELAQQHANAKHHPMLGSPPTSRDKLRKSHNPGRRTMGPPGINNQNRGRGPTHGYMQHGGFAAAIHRTPSSSRRYGIDSARDSMPREDAYPSLNNNHSLFDELSEEDEFGGHRGRQKRQQYNQKKNGTNKAWLPRGRAGGAHGGGGGMSPEYYAPREKSNRSRSRGRRGERY